MDLEQLKQRLSEQVIVVDGVRLAKLSAVDGVEYSKLFSDVSEDAPFEQVATAYAFLLSKSIVDEHGNKTLDSDEARELLPRLATFCKLSKSALEWNIGDSKKN